MPIAQPDPKTILNVPPVIIQPDFTPGQQSSITPYYQTQTQLQVLNPQLQALKTITGTQQWVQGDYKVAFDTTANAVTYKLPTYVGYIGSLIFTWGAGGNVATIAATNSETINGASTLVITPLYGTVALYAGTTGWMATGLSTAAPVVPSAATTVTDIAATKVVGTATSYAREDHVHDGVLSVNGSKGAVTIAIANITPYDNGLGGATHTINWNNGQNQKITLDQLTGTTFTFTNPAAGAVYIFELIQDGGGSKMALWPSSAQFGSISSTLVITHDQADIFTFYYNGSHYPCLAHNSGYVP